MVGFDNVVLAGFLMKSSFNGVRAEIKIEVSVAVVGDECLLSCAVGRVKMLGFDLILALTFPDRNKVALICAKKIV